MMPRPPAHGTLSFVCQDTLVLRCEVCSDPANPLDKDFTFHKLAQLLRHAKKEHCITEEDYKDRYPVFGQRRPAHR